MKIRNLIYCAALMMGVVACAEDVPQEIVPPVSDGRLMLEVSSESQLLTMNESGTEGEVLFRTRGGELFVDVVANVDEWRWSAENAEWLTIEEDEYGLRLVAEENTSDESLSATILITANRSEVNAAVELTVRQNHSGVPEIEAAMDALRIKAHTELSHQIEVLTNQEEWSFDCTCPWLLVEQQDNMLVLTADNNKGEAQREATITISTALGEQSASSQIVVKQDGTAYLRLASHNIATDGEGATKRVEIVSNPELDWTFQTDGGEWYSAQKEDNTLVVTILPNSAGLERFGNITIVVGEEDNNTSATMKIYQISSDTDELIYEIEVTEVPYTHVAAPVVTSGYQIMVDWGDGSQVESFVEKRGSHVYTTPGLYTLSITGSAHNFEFSDGKNLCPEIKNIISWGHFELKNAADMCLGCNKLESIPNDVAGTFANVKSFAGAFSICESLKEIPSGLFRYATLAKNFEDCFSHSASIIDIPEDLFVNCTAAERFSYAFYGTGTGIVSTTSTLGNFNEIKGMVEQGRLKSIPEGLFRNCANALKFDYVFGATAIESIPEAIFAHSPLATTYMGAFSACVNLSTLPVGLLKNATAATNIKYMFAGCSRVESIPVGMFTNCAAVTNLEYIFYKTGVKKLSAGLFEGLSGVKTVGAVFQDCVELSEIEEGVFDGLTAAKSFNYCFSGCTALRTIPEGLFRGLDKAFEFASTFEDSALESVPVGLFADARDCDSADFSYMLAGCSNLKTVPAGLFDKFTTVTSPGFRYCFTGSGIESIPAGLFAKNVEVSTGFENVFYNCANLKTIEGPIFPESSSVSSMKYAFAGCTALEALPAGLFDSLATSKTNFTGTFMLCQSLQTLPAGLFAKNTLATNFTSTFNSCTSLAEIPADLLGNNAKITYVTSMFESCYALKTVPSGLFAGCPAITNFEATFALCKGLESVPADLFAAIGTKTSSINLSECFLECESLKTIPASLFDTIRRINYVDNCFNGCIALTGESPYTIVTDAEGNETKVHLYERTRGDDFPNAPISASAHVGCFAGCVGLSDYENIPADWK